VSVLLRQPHGFEGLRAILEIFLADDQASSQDEDLKLRLADEQAASRSMCDHLDGYEKPVTEVEDLLGIEAHVLEAFKHLAPNLQIAVMAVEGPRCVEVYAGPVKFDAGVNGGEGKRTTIRSSRRRCRLVSGTSGIRTPPAASMVPLRHHLLRQPDGFEGFLPCPKGPPPDDPAVTQGPNVPTAQVHIDAANHPAPVVVHRHNHGVSYGGAFLDLDAVVVKGTPERFQEGDETRMSSIRPRKVVRWQTFGTRPEALEAVGLSEQDAHADS